MRREHFEEIEHFDRRPAAKHAIDHALLVLVRDELRAEGIVQLGKLVENVDHYRLDLVDQFRRLGRLGGHA